MNAGTTTRTSRDAAALAETDPDARYPEGAPLGDLILRTLTPQDPQYAGLPAFEAMHIAALELKALATAAHAIENQSEMPSDDHLTPGDLAFLTSAIASRLDASSELCKRLTQARWDHEGFPGWTGPEHRPEAAQSSDGDEHEDTDHE